MSPQVWPQGAPLDVPISFKAGWTPTTVTARQVGHALEVVGVVTPSAGFGSGTAFASIPASIAAQFIVARPLLVLTNTTGVFAGAGALNVANGDLRFFFAGSAVAYFFHGHWML